MKGKSPEAGEPHERLFFEAGMARMFPERLDPSTCSPAERRLDSIFREQLLDELGVFHSRRPGCPAPVVSSSFWPTGISPGWDEDPGYSPHRGQRIFPGVSSAPHVSHP